MLEMYLHSDLSAKNLEFKS